MATRKYWHMATAVLLASCIASGSVFAQDDGYEEEERETRQVGGISAKTYEKFAKAQEFTEADDYASAIRTLDEIKKQKKLRPAEAIQLYNFYGVIYFTMERFQDSIKAFETMLEQEGIEPRQRTETLYSLAQLQFSIEAWQPAIDIMYEWLKAVPNPPPDPLILLASAHYQLEQYDQMIDPIMRAMSIAEERDKEVKESWWLLLRVAYYEQGNIPKVVEILETLVVKWPKKEYWTMLSGMYGELNKEQRQLAAYESAYDQDLLDKSAEIVTLAQLLMQAEAGYKAAMVLEKGMADGIVDKKTQNYRLQSQALQMAAEYEKAIKPLKQAAAVTKDGELDARLTNSYLNLSRYGDCVDAGKTALRKGGLKKPAIAQEMTAMCLFELDKYDEAKKAFRQAAKDKDVERRARNWIAFIESEQSRLGKLNESITQARAARDAARAEALN